MRFLILVFLLPLSLFGQRDMERRVIKQMLTACDQIRTASFILATQVRNKKGVMEFGEMLVKLNHKPLKLYLHIYHPNSGAELLYNEAESYNNVLVNPNGFPFFNLKLDMNNLSVRKNSHHEVRHISFDHLAGLFSHYLDVFGEKGYSYLAPADTVVWERHTCIKIEFNYPDFGYKNYIAGSGEDAVTIARKLFVNDYMIVCANKEVDDIHDVDPGQTLRIPNMFGKRIIMLVDIRTMLPLVQEIFDDKGLYERYEYRSFVLNPVFDPSEFTSKYDDYGF